jgi:hypothetical protein
MTPLTLPEWKTQGGPTAEQRRFKNTEICREMSTLAEIDSSLSSKSVNRKAFKHLQPNSFLEGNISKLP